MSTKRLISETDIQVMLVNDLREYAGLGPSEAYRRGLVLLANEFNYELHGEIRATAKGGQMTRDEKIAAKMVVEFTKQEEG